MKDFRKLRLILGSIGLLLALGAGVYLFVVHRRVPVQQSRSGNVDKPAVLDVLRLQAEMLVGANALEH